MGSQGQTEVYMKKARIFQYTVSLISQMSEMSSKIPQATLRKVYTVQDYGVWLYTLPCSDHICILLQVLYFRKDLDKLEINGQGSKNGEGPERTGNFQPEGYKNVGKGTHNKCFHTSEVLSHGRRGRLNLLSSIGQNEENWVETAEAD